MCQLTWKASMTISVFCNPSSPGHTVAPRLVTSPHQILEQLGSGLEAFVSCSISICRDFPACKVCSFGLMIHMSFATVAAVRTQSDIAPLARSCLDIGGYDYLIELFDTSNSIRARDFTTVTVVFARLSSGLAASSNHPFPVTFCNFLRGSVGFDNEDDISCSDVTGMMLQHH